MTILNVVLDEMLGGARNGISSYTLELSRALIRYAPPGCSVEGIVASSPETDYQQIEESLPGLQGLFKSALTRRDLTAAWQHGFTPVPTGMVHAPSLFAPLRAHDRVHARGNQIAVTIHDVTPWAHPEVLTPRQVSWAKAMGTRALKYADAVVVPTHAVASALEEFLPFGNRVRVINAAVRSSLTLPADAEERANALDLPARYALAFCSGNARSGLPPLLESLAHTSTDIPLLLVGELGDVPESVAAEALGSERVRQLGALSDEDLAVALQRATVVVHASTVDGFGTTLLEAFSLGAAVVHSDAPALLEVAGDGGLAVPSADAAAYPAALAEAIDRVVNDDELRRTLGILGADRAKLFTWRAAAEGVWQLHADL